MFILLTLKLTKYYITSKTTRDVKRYSLQWSWKYKCLKYKNDIHTFITWLVWELLVWLFLGSFYYFWKKAYESIQVTRKGLANFRNLLGWFYLSRSSCTFSPFLLVSLLLQLCRRRSETLYKKQEVGKDLCSFLPSGFVSKNIKKKRRNETLCVFRMFFINFTFNPPHWA